MNIVISSGHGKYIRGASASPIPPYLDEVDEARKIVEEVAKDLRAGGVTVKTYHDDVSTSQNENLNRIVDYHNAQTRDLDVSVHLNASSKTSKAMGTEVLYVTQASLASEVSSKLAAALQLPNRGGKKRTDLFFLNNTEEPSILIEYCFVDSSTDGEHHRANFVAACNAIAFVIGRLSGTAPPEPIPEPEPEPPVPEPDAPATVEIVTTGSVKVTVNGKLIQDWAEEEEGPQANQRNIIATIFQDDSTAYDPFDAITDTELSVSLPANVGDKAQRDRGVRVYNRKNGKADVGKVRDKGPWLVDDDAYVWGEARPLAETCWNTDTPLPRGPHKGKVPNGAGIDLSPGLAAKLGIDGKGEVDWEWV